MFSPSERSKNIARKIGNYVVFSLFFAMSYFSFSSINRVEAPEREVPLLVFPKYDSAQFLQNDYLTSRGAVGDTPVIVTTSFPDDSTMNKYVQYIYLDKNMEDTLRIDGYKVIYNTKGEESSTILYRDTNHDFSIDTIIERDSKNSRNE
ncbi:MAG: hypothetical protein ACOCU6_01285 [Nanoarchaeota archaeon]